MAKSKGPGRPKVTGPDAPAQQLGIRFSKGLLARLDKWRKAQADQPPRSEAVRLLVETALEKAGY
jgi:metal-responsive CopG/Arc/MetJ family transcriptional regulator